MLKNQQQDRIFFSSITRDDEINKLVKTIHYIPHGDESPSWCCSLVLWSGISS